MRLRHAATLALLAPSILAAQAAPTRDVRGDTLVSHADPAATFVFSKPFQFAGNQAIDILKVAGADQYFFIDAAEDRSIRRFYDGSSDAGHGNEHPFVLDYDLD